MAPENESALDRRSFLQIGLCASAALWIGSEPAVAATAAAPLKSYAALSELAPGAISTQGWILTYLRKQADQLGYSLPDVSEPFTANYWAGEEKYVAEKHEWDESWWAWEQMAYWIDGALRCGLLLGGERPQDRKLTARAVAPIDYTLAHPAADGYLGAQAIRRPDQDYHRWPHAVFFRAVAAYAESKNDPRPGELLRKHYLSDDASYAKPVRNVTNIESMLWAYRQTGDPRLLALAESAWSGYLALPPDSERGDLGREKVLANAPVDSHGVTYIETAKQPAVLYLHTGKAEYLDYALAAQRRITSRYMLVDGVPSTSEFYRSTTSRDVHETCDIADHTWTWGYLLMATGDGEWADRIERACLNAGFGAIRKDWKGLQYLSCPNQMLATQTSSHIPNSGPQTMSYQPNPGDRVACCAANVHRILPNYALRMWMRDAQGGIAAVLYGPSTVKAKVGPEGQQVEIVQRTNFPFDETIEFTIRSAKPVEFPLSLRIPRWCDSPHLQVNGKAADLPPIARGFVTLLREFQPNDVVTLTLPMKTAATSWPDGGIAVEHGPLVYSLPIKETWTSTVRERWSTSAFPSWNAEPASPWNYALAIGAASPAPGAPIAVSLDAVQVHRTPSTASGDDPWVDPPVRLSAPARRVSGWELAADLKDPSVRFSPALPALPGAPPSDPGGQTGQVPVRDFLPAPPAVEVAKQVEAITLVPYGSTHLRVTIFPYASPKEG